MKKYDYFYRLKLKANRENLDVRWFGYMIKQAVEKKIPMLIENSLRVEKGFFYFQTKYPVPNQMLRQMGKEISFTEEEARRYVVLYGNSRQLFARMKELEIEKALPDLEDLHRP